MASFSALPSSINIIPLSRLLRSPPKQFSFPPLSDLKVPPPDTRMLLRCSTDGESSPSGGDPEAKAPVEIEEEASISSSPLGDISSYTWCAGLGAVGFLETSYLTLTKLTSSEAFCPSGPGGGCGDVLNSPYAIVYGIPLPLFGMIAYGSVAALGLQLAGNKFLSGLDKGEARVNLLGLTTSMAAASACFLYILSTEFAGVSCPYCLFSAFLSFTLFFIMLMDFGFQDIQKVAGLQFALVVLVIAVISGSYSTLESQTLSLDDLLLEPYESEIITKSSPLAISLARHLHSIGAKMYGAFWCTHCTEQKQMFGLEAMKIIDYVECFPDGAGKGREIAKECADIGLKGFPTWVVKGQLLSGEQDLESLAALSGFVPEGPSS